MIPALIIGAVWLAGAIPIAVALGRAIRGAGHAERPRRLSVVPDGYAAGRADLQLTHRQEPK